MFTMGRPWSVKVKWVFFLGGSWCRILEWKKEKKEERRNEGKKTRTERRTENRTLQETNKDDARGKTERNFIRHLFIRHLFIRHLFVRHLFIRHLKFCGWVWASSRNTAQQLLWTHRNIVLLSTTKQDQPTYSCPNFSRRREFEISAWTRVEDLKTLSSPATFNAKTQHRARWRRWLMG